MTKNELLMQFQADVLGFSRGRGAVAEITATGAAYAAGLATGFWSGLDELRANYTITRRWQPEMDSDERARGVAAWRGRRPHARPDLMQQLRFPATSRCCRTEQRTHEKCHRRSDGRGASCRNAVRAIPEPVNTPIVAPSAIAATAPRIIDAAIAAAPPQNNHGNRGMNAPIENDRNEAIAACNADGDRAGRRPAQGEHGCRARRPCST